MFAFERCRFADPRSAYSTHQPVLWEMAVRCDGPILEFGCGAGSTPLLELVSRRRGIPVVTFDNDRSWLERFASSMASPLHRFEYVSDWPKAFERVPNVERYGLVFVDQSPWEARAATVLEFRLRADYVVVHDCDYLPRVGLLGRSIRKLDGPHDVGERAYDDVFSSWREYFPAEPWPHATTGPPTLLASNFHDCDIDVDYRRYYGTRALRLLARALGRVRFALGSFGASDPLPMVRDP